MLESRSQASIGAWLPGTEEPAFSSEAILCALERVREPSWIVQCPRSGRVGVGLGGAGVSGGEPGAYPLLGCLPGLYPEWLGDRSFGEAHGVRFAYAAGAMANGIASVRMVIALGRAGFLAFFGAAGLEPAEIDSAIGTIRAELGRASFGSNLIHSPDRPGLEDAVVDIYLRHGVSKVSAAAFMELTPAVLRYACTGLRRETDGRIARPHAVFAKISRPEVARLFLSPPPGAMLEGLVRAGKLGAEEARLAARLPLAEDVTVEADSAGHTDRQALPALLPVIERLRDDLCTRHAYERPVRVGAAGGLGTPNSVAAAFALGAAYVLTGSVNQACAESGLHADCRRLLADVGLADVMTAPSADMFELGAEVQVLKRGTMFGLRARKLQEIHRRCACPEELPDADRSWLEREILRCSIAEAWDATRRYWLERDPEEAERAERDGRHRLALLFRSYLGRASRWAIEADPDRKLDYQIWCGPAMGAFNAWTRGSFLEDPAQRSAVQVARNLMEGAAVVSRAQQWRSCGVPVPPAAFDYRPRPLG
ncbi:MAG: PfaD family polyunsaturated fatty acid/polyketide biosynthesis protein [Deltaproteobacteria bacterium]|nr:PfaD family polyunsaturated fatty acid/polyketide biosynthesis protein [Deltaproteobacteria bacterium]